MKLKVYENRQLEIIQEIGTQNENNVEKIELEVPEKYIDWNKKLVFVMENEVYWDFVQNETYLINRAISQHKEVGIYVWLTQGTKDFRSVTKTMHFNKNEDVSDQITPEEQGAVNQILAEVEAALQEVENVDINVSKSGSVATISITQKDGTSKSVDINDGNDGANGFSPTIRTIETTDGYDLEITDINGTRTITIENGKDGQDGKDGTNGQDGKDGADGKDGTNGRDGVDGVDGVGISSIVFNADNTMTITLTNGNSYTSESLKGNTGDTGATGNGIASISKTGTSGLVDTYTITFTSGNTTTFNVTNGEKRRYRCKW